MSYVPPHLRPGYVRRGVAPAAAAAAARRGVKFLNVVRGEGLPIAPNNGTRHAPRRNARPVRRTLKASKAASSPNTAPKARPTHVLRKLPKTFRKMLMERLGYKHPKKSTRKHKSRGSHKPSKKAKKHGKHGKH